MLAAGLGLLLSHLVADRFDISYRRKMQALFDFVQALAVDVGFSRDVSKMQILSFPDGLDEHANSFGAKVARHFLWKPRHFSIRNRHRRRPSKPVIA